MSYQPRRARRCCHGSRAGREAMRPQSFRANGCARCTGWAKSTSERSTAWTSSSERASSWCFSALPAAASRPSSTSSAVWTCPRRAASFFEADELTDADEEALTQYRRAPRRLRLPVLQPHPEPDRARERRAGHGHRRRSARARGGARAGRARGPPGPFSGAALRRRAAAGRHRARRGQAPSVLLCDEPTGALDFRTGILVLDVIERVNRELGTATAVITHNAPIAEMADRVVTLADGRVQSERRVERRARAARSSLVSRHVALRPRPKAAPRDRRACKGQIADHRAGARRRHHLLHRAARNLRARSNGRAPLTTIGTGSRTCSHRSSARRNRSPRGSRRCPASRWSRRGIIEGSHPSHRGDGAARLGPSLLAARRAASRQRTPCSCASGRLPERGRGR